MFGAAAVRKKRKEQTNNLQNPTRGPYIKPFGPRFDPSTLPYFKYKRALIEAHELKENISGSGPGAISGAQKVGRQEPCTLHMPHRIDLVPLDEYQVWSLSSFEVSCQLLMNDLIQILSVSSLMISSMAVANQGH